MSVWSLIVRELRYRWVNATLVLLGLTTAVALCVSAEAIGRASTKETTRDMRDLGYNVRIIARDTDLSRFWSRGFSEVTLPEDSVHSLLGPDNLTYNHLLALLQDRVSWNGHEVLLTGLSPEMAPPGKKKSAMIFSVGDGELYVGSAVAAALDLERGDAVDFLGHPFEVARCLPESGTLDDSRVYASLDDAQKLLQRPGQINEIQALNCLCLQPGRDTVEELHRALEELMPEARVVPLRALHEVRLRQRTMAVRYAGFLVPLVLVVCGIWVAVLAFWNVRERREEIGVLRALGQGSWRIAMLFQGRAAFLGAAAAVAGSALGTALAVAVAPELFPVTGATLQPSVQVWIGALVGTPLLAALLSFAPTVAAVTQDPASTLQDA